MAQKVNVQLLDDLDGSLADHTIEFSLDGVHYEIDLSLENAERLRGELKEFVANARRVGGRHNGGRIKRGHGLGGSSFKQVKTNREHNGAVRDWAIQNGYSVSDRGRIARKIQDAFEAAHA